MIDQCLCLLNSTRSYFSEQENCCMLKFESYDRIILCVCAAPVDAWGRGEYSCGNTALWWQWFLLQ